MSSKPPKQLQYSIHIYIAYITSSLRNVAHYTLILCLTHLRFRQYIHILAVHLIYYFEFAGCHRQGQIK